MKNRTVSVWVPPEYGFLFWAGTIILVCSELFHWWSGIGWISFVILLIGLAPYANNWRLSVWRKFKPFVEG